MRAHRERSSRWAGRLAALAALAAASPSLASAPLDDQPTSSILDASSGCVPSARYVAPADVAADTSTDPGVAPADLAGSSLSVDVPNEIAFPLFVDPFPPQTVTAVQPPPGDEPVRGGQPGQTAAQRAGSSLYLGEVTYDRARGDVGVGGSRIAAPSDECR